MYLPMLTDEELLRHADQMAATDLERELIKRLGALLELREAISPLNGIGLEIEDVPSIVKILDEFYATDAEALREKLQRAHRFYDIARDAGDVLDRLSELAKDAA